MTMNRRRHAGKAAPSIQETSSQGGCAAALCAIATPRGLCRHRNLRLTHAVIPAKAGIQHHSGSCSLFPFPEGRDIAEGFFRLIAVHAFSLTMPFAVDQGRIYS